MSARVTYTSQTIQDKTEECTSKAKGLLQEMQAIDEDGVIRTVRRSVRNGGRRRRNKKDTGESGEQRDFTMVKNNDDGEYKTMYIYTFCVAHKGRQNMEEL